MGGHVLLDERGRLALVESGRALVGDPLERAGQVGLLQDVAGLVRRAVLRELRHRRRVGRHRLERRPQRPRQSLGHAGTRRAPARWPARPAASTAASRAPSTRGAGPATVPGHADRQVAVVVHGGAVLPVLEEHRRRRLRRRHLAEVVRLRRAGRRPVDDEAAAADVAGRRVRDGEREGGGDGRVDRRAAVADRLGAGLRRQRVLRHDHRAARANRLLLGERGAGDERQQGGQGRQRSGSHRFLRARIIIRDRCSSFSLSRKAWHMVGAGACLRGGRRRLVPRGHWRRVGRRAGAAGRPRSSSTPASGPSIRAGPRPRRWRWSATGSWRSAAAPRSSDLRGPGTRVIDAGGRFLMPGFNDAHIHLMTGGAQLDNVDLKDAATPAEFARRIGDRAKTTAKGEWVLGGNWDEQAWPGAPLPTRELVDAVTPDTPVFVNRYDEHMSLANSVALHLAGVTARTPDPPGGVIVRDAKGNPTGILKDAAQAYVYKVIPAPTAEQRVRTLRRALAHMASLGVTSVQDMGPDPDDVAVYAALAARGELTARIRAVPAEVALAKQLGRGRDADPEDDRVLPGQRRQGIRRRFARIDDGLLLRAVLRRARVARPAGRRNAAARRDARPSRGDRQGRRAAVHPRHRRPGDLDGARPVRGRRSSQRRARPPAADRTLPARRPEGLRALRAGWA